MIKTNKIATFGGCIMKLYEHFLFIVGISVFLSIGNAGNSFFYANSSTKILDKPEINVGQCDSDIYELVPAGWSILEKYDGPVIVEGDLNKDEVADKVFIIEQNGDNNEISQRNLLIAFGKKNGGYELSIEAEHAILNEDAGGTFGDPFDELKIDRGSILLKFMGGSSRWSKIFRFRYQDAGWYLIGFTKDSYESLDDQIISLTDDYNLITGECLHDVLEDGDIETIKKNIGIKPLVNLIDFVVDEY